MHANLTLSDYVQIRIRNNWLTAARSLASAF